MYLNVCAFLTCWHFQLHSTHLIEYCVWVRVRTRLSAFFNIIVVTCSNWRNREEERERGRKKLNWICTVEIVLEMLDINAWYKYFHFFLSAAAVKLWIVRYRIYLILTKLKPPSSCFLGINLTQLLLKTLTHLISEL